MKNRFGVRQPAAGSDCRQRLVRDALRYRALKEKIEYADGGDGMAWATLNWCVDVYSLSPSDLDDAIDQILLANSVYAQRNAE